MRRPARLENHFRSSASGDHACFCDVGLGVGVTVIVSAGSSGVVAAGVDAGSSVGLVGSGGGVSASGAPGRTGPGRSDRESTRLNSSHVKISYAVFCLKKKMLTRTWAIVQHY